VGTTDASKMGHIGLKVVASTAGLTFAASRSSLKKIEERM